MTGNSGEMRRDDRAERADGGEDQRRQPRPEPIDDDAADQHHDDVREAVDGVERADLRVGEAEQPLQRVGDRADRVVGVVVAEHRDADGDEHAQRQMGGRGGLEGVGDSGHEGVIVIPGIATPAYAKFAAPLSVQL